MQGRNDILSVRKGTSNLGLQFQYIVARVSSVGLMGVRKRRVLRHRAETAPTSPTLCIFLLHPLKIYLEVSWVETQGTHDVPAHALYRVSCI